MACRSSPRRRSTTTSGLVVDTGAFTLTADYFRVDVTDRLALSQTFTLTAAERALLLSEGITSAGTLAFFRFFINDFSSRTQGVDLVSTYTPPAFGGDTILSFTMNFTDTSVTEETALLGPGDVRGLELGVPRIRWNAALNQQAGRVGLLGRLHYYGSWVDHFDARFVRGADAPLLPGKFIVDLEAGIPLGRAARLAVGGPERLRHLLGPAGPVRHRVRPALQPVHALGPQRRLLLRPHQLPVGPLGACAT